MTTDNRTGPHRPTATLGGWGPSPLFRLFLGLGERFDTGTLTVELPGGLVRRLGGARPGPEAHLAIHHPRLARRFLLRGNLGFCEAYIDGDWSSRDVEALFRFFLVNQERVAEEMRGRPWIRALTWLRHAMRRNTRAGSRRNIAQHYDLGNEFYARWLDPSMTYSSAVFDSPAMALQAAQRRKYALLADRLELVPDQRVLEIGCGWGGFAEYAAGERGAQVTAITVSQAQHDFARRRIFEAGLAERVDVRLQDYRDTTGRFDAVASIEMFEAVGERYWPRFFATVSDRLGEAGRAALQIITIDDAHFAQYRRSADYIQRYIFPGGMLPSLPMLDRLSRGAGLEMVDTAGLGAHYARTLRDWNSRFQAAWGEIAQMGFDLRFKRMWEQYLHYCAAGFTVGRIDVHQVALRKG